MLEVMFFFILAQLNIFLLLSQFTESPEVVDKYLLVSFILLSVLTIARVVLDITLCSFCLGSEDLTELLGPNKMKVLLR